ncbi:MAG: Hsp20/alpha crystallin family protein [Deltaproteobacteria bacterium]|jgi:HSP20 family protein|nr:Hsp20/alpha crystallin family protein [Deltaproteobacteria bacterium]
MTQTNTPELNVHEKRPLDPGSAEHTSTTPQFSPQVDIWENDQGLTVVADMPGVTADGLNIDLNDNVLTIHGHVLPPSATRKLLAQEFEVGDYYRQFKLSEDIDKEAIAATIKDGVLTVSLPKQAPAQPRKINVVTA